MLQIFIGLLLGAIFGGVLFYFYKSKKEGSEQSNTTLIILQNQINEITKMLDARLHESRKEMREQVQFQFGESQKLIKDITKQLTEVREGNKQVFGIAEQLQNLEKVLKNQKQRGNLGEAGLALILGNILPSTAYKMQYEFKNGDKVDAAIITPDGIIPVDAKYSLDNYNRIINEKDESRKLELEKEFKNDLKKRIDETAKYIRTEEGTLPFAFMFIPAEGIYYDLLINEVGAVKVNTRNLIDYAYKDKNVVIISPTTFTAYLQSVLYGFRAFKIEKSAQDIVKRVEELRKHLAAYEMYMQKLGNNIGLAVGSFNLAYRELGKVDKDVIKISGTGFESEIKILERPDVLSSE